MGTADKTLFGLPVVQRADMKLGRVVFGRFDQIADGIEVEGLLFVVGELDENGLVFTAKCLRDLASQDPRFGFDEERKCLIVRGTVKGNKIV